MSEKHAKLAADKNKVHETQGYRLITEWNATESSYPKELCVHHLFEAQVEKTPHYVAVVFENTKV